MARPLPVGCQGREMIYDGGLAVPSALRRGLEGPACRSGHGPGGAGPAWSHCSPGGRVFPRPTQGQEASSAATLLVRPRAACVVARAGPLTPVSAGPTQTDRSGQAPQLRLLLSGGGGWRAAALWPSHSLPGSQGQTGCRRAGGGVGWGWGWTLLGAAEPQLGEVSWGRDHAAPAGGRRPEPSSHGTAAATVPLRSGHHRR